MKTFMKYVFVLSFIFACPVMSNGQYTERAREVIRIIDASDSIPDALFLDTGIIKRMTLTNKTRVRRVWTNFNDTQKHIHQFYDLRVRFDSDSAALAFHRDYIDESSEGGPKVKTKFKSPEGVEGLKLFTHDEKLGRLIYDPYGLQVYCYLFVVDNYAVKFYIVCPNTYKPDYFLPHIIAARDKIRALKEK